MPCASKLIFPKWSNIKVYPPFLRVVLLDGQKKIPRAGKRGLEMFLLFKREAALAS